KCRSGGAENSRTGESYLEKAVSFRTAPPGNLGGGGDQPYQPGVPDTENPLGKHRYRTFTGDSSGKGLGLRLDGRDQCGGRLGPISPLQDRRGIRGKDDSDGAGRGLCDQGRTGRMI